MVRQLRCIKRNQEETQEYYRSVSKQEKEKRDQRNENIKEDEWLAHFKRQFNGEDYKKILNKVEKRHR